MSLPPVLPGWATDEKYTSGDDVGLDTRLAPTAGEIAQGFHRGKRPPARKMNWLLGTICDWIAHLSNDRPHTFLITEEVHDLDIPALFPWAKLMRIRLCGGGGGGGAGSGGGSGYLVEVDLPPQIISVYPGQGGSGGNGALAGGSGVNSAVLITSGPTIIARGGQGGQVGPARGGDGYSGGGGKGIGNHGGSSGLNGGGANGGLGIAMIVGGGHSYGGGPAGDHGAGGAGGFFTNETLAGSGGPDGGKGGQGYGAGGGAHNDDICGNGAPGAAEVTLW